MIVCQACGTENPPTASYCSRCARKLDADTQAAVVKQRESHIATGIRWTSVLLTALAILIVAIIIAFIIAHVA